MVFHQALTYGLFLIVFTGGQLFAGHVVFAFNLRRVEFDVVNAARSSVYATTHDTVNDQLVRNVEFKNVVHVDACFFHGISLRNSTREAIKQETITAVFLSNTLFYQRDHQLISHQLTGVHDVFRLFAQLGARFHGSTQHITGGDLRNTILLHDELSLSSFTRARSAKQNDTHYENPLKGCRYF